MRQTADAPVPPHYGNYCKTSMKKTRRMAAVNPISRQRHPPELYNLNRDLINNAFGPELQGFSLLPRSAMQGAEYAPGCWAETVCTG